MGNFQAEHKNVCRRQFSLNYVPVGGIMSLRLAVNLITGTAITVSSLAHTSSAPTINIDGLAQVTGILSHCAKVDPHRSAKYMQALGHFLSGVSSSEIRGDRNTSAYDRAEKKLDIELARVPSGTVVSACKDFLAGK
jgi:hypothetical protein